MTSASLILAAIAANVVNGLVSERTGTVYPARARTEILKDGAVFRIALESAIAPEGLSRRVLPAEGGGPSAYVGVDDCVYFSCGGRRLFVNANGAWRGDRPDGVGTKTLGILTWHFLCFKFVSWILILYYHLPIDRLSEFPVVTEYSSQGWWMLYLVAGLLLPIVIDNSISIVSQKVKEKVHAVR